MNLENRDSSRYLEQHLEPEVAHNERQPDFSVLETPLDAIDYKTEGKECIKSESFEMTFSYRAPNFYEHKKLGFLGVESREWRTLDALVLDNKDADTFDLSKEIEGYTFFFRPDVGVKAKSNANLVDKYIAIRGDFSKPSTILTFLHELGHCKDYESIKDEGEKDIFESGHKALHSDIQLSPETLQRVLLRERNAWAYALRKFKPFLGQQINKDDVQKYIHDYALASYSKGIRKKIEKGLSDWDWSQLF